MSEVVRPRLFLTLYIKRYITIIYTLYITEMLLRQKDPKEFTVQTSRSEFKTGTKNEDGQLRAKENVYIQ